MSLGDIRLLSNPIQAYSWGSRTALAELLGRPQGGEPQAELWMGAHPRAPSRVRTPGGEVPLDAWIARDPVAVLGRRTAERFGALPFLFKVLAAEEPLSLQAHPDLEQARTGFARENAAGVPVDAPERCYRDANHKPELICALTRFQALSGFREADAILAAFETLGVPGLAAPLEALRRGGDAAVAPLFHALMTLDAGARGALVARAAERARRAGTSDAAQRWVAQLAEAHPADVGALAPLLLNVVELAPGQAMFLPAGQLHSYLSGVGVEIMANSDNVLRGGLTPKHIDVPELLRTLSFRSGPVDVLEPRPGRPGECCYDTPAEEFALSVVEVSAGTVFEADAERDVEILLCTEGSASIEGREVLALRRGDCALVPAAAGAYRIEGDAVLYRAMVGVRRPLSAAVPLPGVVSSPR